jgi:hypothetical protein
MGSPRIRHDNARTTRLSAAKYLPGGLLQFACLPEAGMASHQCGMLEVLGLYRTHTLSVLPEGFQLFLARPEQISFRP